MNIYTIVLTELASRKLQCEAELNRLVNLNTITSSEISVNEQVSLIINELNNLLNVEKAFEKWVAANPTKEIQENK